METTSSKINAMDTKSTSKKKYSFYAKFNGIEHKYEVDDLKEAFAKCKPMSLKTRIILRIRNSEGVCSRIFMANKGRMLFKNNGVLDAFINNLIFKPDAS